jgi:leucyl aminopeptidase
VEFSIKVSAPEKQPGACVAVGVFESRKLSASAEQVDKAARGQIKALLRSGDMDGKLGSTRLLYRVPGVAAERVLLVGLGRDKDIGEK